MKKLLSIMLTIAMIMTIITIPTIVSATETLDGDYVAGDNIKLSFDADNPTDLTGLVTDDGADVGTVTYGGEIYAYSTGSSYLYVPIAPGVPGNEPIYVKIRVHARALEKFGAGTGLQVYTKNSQGKQIATYINDGDLGVTGLVSADASAPGLDIIFKMNPDTADGYDMYVRPVGSDGEWTTIYTAKTYGKNTALQVMRVGYNLAISDVKVYTKQAPELEAVNRAADAEAMAAAVSANAAALGVDLTKLDAVNNDNAVYAKMVGTVYYSAAEVVAAFNAAVSAQLGAEFDADYCEGDSIKLSFDADNPTDFAGLVTDDGADVATITYGGETYAYSTGSSYLYVPIAPGVPGNEPIYVKVRVHARAIGQFGAGTGLQVYTKNSQGKQIATYINDGDLGVTGLVSADASAPGLDIIFKMNPDTADGYDMYVRPVGSEGEWTTIATAKAYNNNNALQVMRVGYNLTVSDVKVYTKQAPELAAVNKAADADEMEAALAIYATTLGVDLTKLNGIKNTDAVYGSLLDTVFATAAEVVSAFDAAVTAQLIAEFDSDYVVGDVLAASFDADRQTDLARLVTDDGAAVETVTYGGETYAYSAGSSYLYVPIAPGVPDDEPIYVKARVHARALGKFGAGSGLQVYTVNSQGKQIGTYINDGDLGVSGLVSADADAPGLDIIFKMNPTAEEGYDFYVRPVGSEGAWTTISAGKAYNKNSALQVMRVGYNTAISDVKVYKKTFATLTKTAETAEKWSFEVAVSAKIGASSMVYVGAYDENDVLIGAAVEPYNTTGNTTVEMDIPTGTAEYFKAFIWNQNADPLVAAVTLNN